METSKLKRFASFARTSLIEQVGTRLKSVLADQSLARRESAAAVAELEKKIKELGKERVIDMVAYTWFNRFCALRFMDVNQYTTIGTVSPAEGFTQPEILTEAKQGVIDEELKVDRAKILGLLDGTRPSQDAQGEVYQQLLIAVCNSYHKLMPFMFEKIADFTELLIPEDLLSDSSVLAETRKALTVENCADVEVIGWLYQFYISEKKDEVINRRGLVAKEEIPAATQLFTPHWIVRYLVENSLGRLWMLNHPESKLVEQMDYYIKPEEPETDFLKVSSPEDIKICDPACGSGHMLTYAFDLLYAIYEEQGYQATDIPRLILKHNLYGVEIDQRAGALAAFALVMKAREKDKRFFTRKSQPDASARDSSSIQNPKSQIQNPNVCVLENIKFDQQELSDYIEQLAPDLFTDGIRGVVNQWEEADNFGSLIRPLVTDVREVLELLRERQMGQDLFLAGVHQKVLKALRQADFLNPKYHVVVANPPYMNPRGMNPSLRSYVKKVYADFKADLFAAFLRRSFDMALKKAPIGFVSPFVWLYIASYQELRQFLVKNCIIRSLVQLEYNAFAPACIPVCCYVIDNKPGTGEKGTYIRLSEFRGAENQSVKTLEAIANPKCGWLYKSDARNFGEIPTTPIAYWISPKIISSFKSSKLLAKYGEARGGLQTGDTNRFLRKWFEVSLRKISFDSLSRDDAKGSSRKWFPHQKGGSARKWYGNNEFVVNWEHDGKEIFDHCEYLNSRKASTMGIASTQFYFRRGVTWGLISSSHFTVRFYESGMIFDINSPTFFPRDEADYFAVGCYLNSNTAGLPLECFNQTISAPPGIIEKLPFIDLTSHDRNILAGYATELIEISKNDWDSSETSWDFGGSPLIGVSPILQAAWDKWRSDCDERIDRMKKVEEDNNRFFISAFGLEDELNECVDRSSIYLRVPELTDDLREFISYSVGCMLGRYSLDKPGLILANQGETAADYRQQIPEPTFAPDEDNVIPLLDGDWFEDDITERFKAFLNVTFGTEHYEENLKFMEDALYPDNLTSKKRKTIRDYFLKDFYSHHIKLYKKRPIYWLFSSPKGTFNALIYMHRYRPDTVGTVLHYLRDFRDKLTHHADHQQMLADSASASKSEKTQAIKDVAAIKKQLKELEEYEKTLFEVAARKIDIDLDDGVKHNYQLFGSVLRKIPGLDAKED
jgi:type II restriction/modification system DNA methylase subunit YeeA